MRRLSVVLVSLLIFALLAACASTESSDDSATDDSSDDVVAAESSLTPDEADPTPTATAEPDSTETAEPDADPEETATPETAENGDPVEHIVEIQDPHDFDPDELVIALGDTITFINTGRINHTATLDPEIVRNPDNAVLPEGAEPWDSGDLDPGDEFSITLEVPGDYVYFCRPHEVLGQIGSITVLEEGETPPESSDDDSSDDDQDNEEVDDYL